MRARASARLRRFSLTRRVWICFHSSQASLEICCQMRVPSSPGYGGKSSPSASRLSFTQLTIRDMVCCR
ncbi:Uncharacterised protein [Bordetella pertussis]|nr:Uncharacterised protein [Bordetella pertussis]